MKSNLGVSKVLRSIAEGLILMADELAIEVEGHTAERRETKVTKPTSTKKKKVDELEEELEEEIEEETEEEVDLDMNEETEEEEVITLADISKAFKNHINTFKVKGKVNVVEGRKSAIAIMKKINATDLNKIKESDYKKVMDLLSK